MICEDDEWVFCPAQVVSPVCEGFHDGQEFSFVDIVISFCGGEGRGVIHNWM